MTRPEWWSAIVCTICQKREVSADGVYLAQGHVLCVPCADLAENALRVARKRREKKAKGAA